ncbi:MULTISPECIES: hypothetical protein [Curtobacterium]|jgi:hypothetical protein|uniref:Uncharacterized protein n=2 Tax=Curtobacterium TaxID=2034 RepID=A0A5P8YU93_9MICO|nr:hypothetical protein [Curtobacterium flaccumfaciens]MBO9041476.1 hypothetical protein [Curtobacterium flaccumfaciens pv. flaccumfaciens]MBO9044962.1 hypothetical protein [Curtobacterium flaccumfaciens pv. flaccumfaciens]MBO9048895.1 hypothetical protein [Curtobacterium flaccumfaciens pv. flaccumfaciens]MBO9057746.1 hypothetical protein [Curtobacterium flaccumfaciens pv. flaccumfaciens]MBT1543185.1 hypothetical protein [Curtobacterium flaccumfaciens pv. flaccumfaciens]
MTINPRLAPVAAAALGALVFLAGCTSTPAADPTASSSKTTTPTPTRTPYAPISKPGSVEAPKDENAAWKGASAAVKDFIAVQYEIQHDGGADPERIDKFAISTARDSVHTIAKQIREQKFKVYGAPKWAADAEASSYGALIDHDGTQIPNGTVYVVGCFDTSDQVSKKADGTVVPKSKTVRFPVQLKTQYIPEDKAWEVAETKSISGQGAPQC